LSVCIDVFNVGRETILIYHSQTVQYSPFRSYRIRSRGHFPIGWNLAILEAWKNVKVGVIESEAFSILVHQPGSIYNDDKKCEEARRRGGEVLRS
jgi:hypothetical protein